LARILYRFHPFFDRQVTVLRTIRRGEIPAMIVRVEPLQGEDDSEELRISIPLWMLDDATCSRIVVNANGGRIAIDALLRLRTLVDSGLMVAKGDRHESTTTVHEDVANEAADA
jgi:hypothetical protein